MTKNGRRSNKMYNPSRNVSSTKDFELSLATELIASTQSKVNLITEEKIYTYALQDNIFPTNTANKHLPKMQFP